MNSPAVTVFGATGFLGRAIARELADDGWEVRIAARDPEVQIPGIATDRSVRLPTDIRDERSVAAALEGASAAVNAVSLYKQLPGLRFRDILAQVLRDSGRRRMLVPVPFALWRLVVGVLALLPQPPLTISQVQLMAMDNVADPTRPGFAELDISPLGIGEALSRSVVSS